jgi:mRNA interferase HicA
VRFNARHGKGSHGRLYYGDRFTIVKDRKQEIGPGLFAKMLRDLDLRREDMEG